MKNILILFLFCISIFFADALAEFLPGTEDVNESSVTYTQEFEKIDDTSTSEFIVVESNSSSVVPLEGTQIEETPDKYGTFSYDHEINVSKIEDVKGYSDSTKNTISYKGGTLFQSMSAELGGVDTANMETLKSDYITQEDANSSEARAILFNKRFYEKARSLVANLKTMDCYVTRKLVNSYYCPLPGMENSFFKGGAAKDSNDEAKKACNDLCSLPVSCINKDMEKELAVSKEINAVLGQNDDNEEVYYIDIDDTMLPRFIEVTLSNKYQYDEDIPLSSSDYNATKALEVLKNTNHGVKFSLSYMDDDEKWNYIEKGFEVKLNNLENSFKIYLTAIRTKQIKIIAYHPYMIDKNAVESEDEKLETSLNTLNIQYIGNSWWFCPEINIVTKASECSGEVKNIIVGSQAYNVCVEEGRKKIEPTYGAFWTQGECEAACKTIAECVPTYKHLSGIDPYNLPSSLKDVEVGCVDNPSNTSCTEELCMEYFTEDIMPYLEKSWTNDDEVVITVSSGIPSQTVPRPRIDIDGGISANGDEEARAKSEIKEMAEISYMNMLNGNSYDISKYVIEKNIPPQYAYELETGSTGASLLKWKMRPWTYDIDDGNSYYVYILFDIYSRFTPVASFYKNEDGSIPIWNDRTFVLKTPMSYKIVRRIENYEVMSLEDNGTRIVWNKVDSMMIDKYETFDGNGFSVFDIDDDAEYYKQTEFKSDKNWEEFLVYNSLEEVCTTPGVLFHSQNIRAYGTLFDRVFTGDVDDNTSAVFQSINVLGVYSKDKLSYKELFEAVEGTDKEKYLIFSTITQANKEIHSDGAFDLDRVKMYISGKLENMTVKADFTPLSKEEGKKAFIFMLLYDENVSN